MMKRSTELMKEPVFLTKAQRDQLLSSTYLPYTTTEKDEKEQKNHEDQEKKMKEEKLTLIKEQYLVGRPSKKPYIKPTQKSRFSFDWDYTKEDTTCIDEYYEMKQCHEAQLLFGRGFRAGVDRQGQKKKNVHGKRLYEYDRRWSEKSIEEMNERDWRIFNEHCSISYKGNNNNGTNSRIRPMRNWEESKVLSSDLLKAVEKAGYKTPTPIQMAAIPFGIQQRDFIAVAQTGSGKTAAFVIPMLDYISRLGWRLPCISTEEDGLENEGPYVVVLAPTRELALQIEREAVKFARYLERKIRVVAIVGGQSIEEQGFKIRQGCDVVVATPGRLLDCLERRYVVLNQCNYVVLDEADRMIDMGFENQVLGILDSMSSSNSSPDTNRTTFMFSATMPPSVERLARKNLRNPVMITVGMAGKPTELITQNVIMLKESEKFSRLKKLLEDELGNHKTAIVFVNTRMNADLVSDKLDKAGFQVAMLRGGKSQDQREVSLEGFRTRRYNVLVASDVAGRGIDVPDVSHVVNYDMPSKIEMYTHRIGRTGRAGKNGVATTFLTLNDTGVFYDLKQVLIQSHSHVPPELARHEASRFKPGTIPELVFAQ